MKKILALLMIISLIFVLAACSGNEKSSPDNETSSASSENSAAATEAPSEAGESIDVDLTAMSSTMIYSEVLNMQQHPDEYMGKTVKMTGTFSVTKTETNTYFACIVKDATACCAAGIEFDPEGDLKYPLDFPQPQSTITVTGEFTTYMEGKDQYLQLKDAQMSY